ATPSPQAALTLGGLPGLIQKFQNASLRDRLNLLPQALQYDQGIHLLHQALQSPHPQLTWAAYRLLETHPDRHSRTTHSPYTRFQNTTTLVNDRRNKVETVAIAPNGKLAIAGTRRGLATIWDLTRHHPIHQINLAHHHNLIQSNQLDGRQVRWVSFTPDSQTALITSVFGSVIIWSLLLQSTVHVMQGYSPIASTLLDDTYLIAGATEPNAALRPYLRVGNIKTGRQARMIDRTDLVNAVALSTGQNILCTGHDKGDIKLWNWYTGEFLTTYQHPCWVHSVILHPTAPILISAGGGFIRDYTVQIWDTNTGAVRGILAGHDGRINCMALSHDGHILVTGSSDCKVKIWDLASNTELASLAGHWEQITSVAITPNGQQIISGSYDGSVRIWSLPQPASPPSFP
ncbi:WD40 repeat domain-containing protein, partial [filamentous cyanobacterium LEGE 11480]